MTDQELIKLCKQGDRQAFNELVEKYQERVVNIAYGLLSNKEDAYDAAQETFIKVYRSINSFAEKSSFNTWIYRILSNVCKDMLRKRQRSVKVISIHGEDNDEKPHDIPDTNPTPEETVERNELHHQVWSALHELKTEYREIIVYFDMQGLSYEEVSVALGIPIGTVKSRLNRARCALKKILYQNKEQFQNKNV